MKDFNDIANPKTGKGKFFFFNFFKSACALDAGREFILNAFRKIILPIKTQGQQITVLTPTQMIQRLPIALAQVKSCNTFENLKNEIRPMIYSLYWTKEITKKVYNNIMHSIKPKYKNSKTSDHHRLLLNLTDKNRLEKKR